jgi:DNA-binding beta-propeller fold protein YncE
MSNASLLFLALSAAGLLLAESTPAASLLVLSKTDKTLAIVDPANLKIIAKLPSGPDPHEVEASTDGRLAFISNYGGGAYNTITVIDLVEQKSLGPIDLGPLRAPHGLMFAAGKVWFTAEAAKIIGSIDPASRKIDWMLGTGQNRTHMVWVSEDAKWLATSDIGSATITIIEKTVRRPGPPPGGPGPGPAPAGGPGGPPPGGGQPDWDEVHIPVGRGVEGFDVSPDHKEIWCANAQDGTISIIDVAAKKVVATLQANVRGANRLKFTPDGKRVFVSTLGGSDVSVFDAATRADVKRIRIGRGAAGIQMQPNGARVFVACTPDNYVTVIDGHTLEIVDHLDVGKQPDGMAWAIRK